MLFILFSIGPARYALPVDRIVEVVPLVQVQAIPQAPPAVTGLMNYRGRSVPVIDLRIQLLNQPSELNLSTRIVILQPDSDKSHLIGLVAEKATETERFRTDEFQPQTLQMPEALQLGPVRVSSQGMVQMVQPENLLSPEMKTLFQGVWRGE